MKRARRSIIGVLVMVLMITSMPFVSFAGSTSLEKLFKSDPGTLAQLKKQAKAQNVKLKIKGNTVFYVYDMKSMLSKEQAFSPKVKNALKKALKKNKGTFTKVCKGLRKSTGIRNIKVVVKYTYNDKKVVAMTFKE